MTVHNPPQTATGPQTSDTNRTLRWIVDPPLDGPTNMARDEALLTLVGRGVAPPTLRFYRWSPATISLGYFQSFADYATLAPPAGRLPVVRRQTGGGAILHDRELTYALVLPVHHPLLEEGPNRLYHHVHGAFAAWLARYGLEVVSGRTGGRDCSRRGPFFCFERHSCFDLLAGGRKLMGSAQRRTRHAVLQHGSLILERTYDQQVSAAVADVALPPLDEHLAELAEAIAAPATPEAGQFTREELTLAEQLQAKYADPAWTCRR